MSQQNIDDRADRRVGIKMGETGELQVKALRGNAVRPAQGSAGAVGYDLCAANNYMIPSRSKGTIETGLQYHSLRVHMPGLHHVQGLPSGISSTLGRE